MSAPPHDLPIDETSRASLAADGLTFGLVDATDHATYDAWFRAETRGFLGQRPSPGLIEQRRTYLRDERLVGVWDASAAEPETPVATAISWLADLTLPGRTSLAAWAISGVTVAATHRRRGIARALLEAELRTAVGLGLPFAILTVSESTIYGRFGFGPAAMARNLTIDTRRARWIGPEPTGRVHFVSVEQVQVDGLAIVERVRLETPGQVSYGGILWDRQLGLTVDDTNAVKLRYVRYDDADGAPQGFAVYSVIEDDRDFVHHEVKVHTLVAATTDAYAGLWRFILEMDLVSTVTAHLRPVDEPLRWMISDFRAVHTDDVDHLWTRVLDVAAALGARTYAAPGRLVLHIRDPLEFAAGTWALDVDPLGTGTVVPTTEPADVTMTVNALGSLLLGGVPARTLAAAGQLSGDAPRLDHMFRSPVEPFLSIWF